MDDSGSGKESDDESLSPIFGFSFDEEGNVEESRWRIDPHLDVKKNGFTTAAGKAVEISEKAIEEAKRKFDAVEIGSCPTESKISMLSDHMNTTESMKSIGFTTAAGKPIQISEKALEEAKKKFDAVEKESFPIESKISMSSDHRNATENMQSIGFTTAAGKAIKISEKALEEAKRKFDAVEKESVPIETKFTVSSDHMNTTESMKPIGFTTAAGRAIKISEKAIEEAKRKFDAVEIGNCPTECKMPMLSDLMNTTENPKSIGFTTAAGKAIKVSEKALEDAKRKFDAVEKESFPTESTITMSSNHMNTTESMKPIGFTTAAGKAIKVSEKALEEAKRKFDAVEKESVPIETKFTVSSDHRNTTESMKPIGFTTAAGKAIKVSEKALEDAKRKFDAVEKESFPIESNISMSSDHMNTTESMKSIGFTTAAGKAIKVSEKALEEAKRKFDAVDNESLSFDSTSLEKSDQPELNEKKPMEFASTSSKAVKISDKTLEESRKNSETFVGKSATEELNDSEKSLSVSLCTSDVFDFAQTSPVMPSEQSNEIEDLTLSLLMDASTNDESCWDNCDDSTAVEIDSLAAIPSDGEIVPMLKVVLVRAYPILYCIRLAGSNLFLSKKAFLYRQMSIEEKKEELREKLLPEIEQKIRKSHFSKTIPTLGKTAVRDMNVDDIVMYLNSADDGSTSHIMNELSLSMKTKVEEAQMKIEDKIRAEVHEEFAKQLKSLDLESRASPVFRLRVVDIGPYHKEDFKSRGGTISIWNPNEEVLNAVKENIVFEFQSLKQNILQSFSDIRLSTTKGSIIHPTETTLVKNSFARKFTTIQEVVSGNFSPLYEEFDTVGLIIEVTSYATSSGQMIRISDQWKNTLKVKFWNSLKDAGLEDLLKVGTFIACLNLQWRQSSAKNGMAYAQDVSCFHTNTKEEHLVQGYQDLCLAIKDVVNFDADNEDSKDQQNVVKEASIFPIPEPKKEAESPLEQSKIRSSIKRRYLEQYGEPPELPPLCSPAKRGRVSRKFVVPRRVDSKPPS